MRWLLLLLLTGCAPHYTWTKWHEPSERVEWRVVAPQQLEGYCGWKRERGFTTLAGCAVQVKESKTCFIFSYLTEQQAQVTYDLDGLSIYEHEMAHCQGWRHQ